MFNGVHFNPHYDSSGETPEKGEDLGFNEMTQDVIEWDESKNMELDKKYLSPQPPGSGSKGSATRGSGNRSKSSTPLSTSSVNSSLYLGAKRRKKRTEPGNENVAYHNGIRTAQSNAVDTTINLYNVDKKPNRSATALPQRHRRRRLGYPLAYQNERKNPMPVNTSSFAHNQSKSATARHDDFAQLLEAISTPKSGQKPRVPLSPVDPNRSEPCSSKNNTSKKRLLPPPQTSSIPATENNHSFPQPNFCEPAKTISPKECQTRESNQLPPTQSIEISASDTKLTNGSDDISDKDEFGEIDFSEDDLAQIDSLTQPQSEPPVKEVAKASVISRHDAPRNKTDEIIHQECVKESSDEFGDFPSDVDFSQIDDMVSNQPSKAIEERPTQCAKPKSIEKNDFSLNASSKHKTRKEENVEVEDDDEFGSFPDDVDFSALETNNTSANVQSNTEKHNEKAKMEEVEDDDEFGSFPGDVDFSTLDAAVATQCCRPKPVDGKIAEEEDEFGDFPDDIDFNVLDQVVTESISKPRVIANPSCDPVRNQKSIRRGCEQTSFMNFSRYKVLSVDTDERNNTKILRVATWINSMADSDEVRKKFLKDGRIKRSECHVHGEDNNCIFTHAARDIDYPEDGLLYLCGEWSFTPVQPGDVIHVCSLAGQYKTDTEALPIVLHSYPPPGSDVDDLILVLHPEMLMSPSIISETATCNRRAALKSKIGSSGISAKSACIGTMRHGLFEACMKSAEFDVLFAQRAIKKIIRENAEMLIGCNVTEAEAEAEILGVLPMIQQFAKEYTTLRNDVMMLSSLGKPVGGVACHPDIRLLVKGVHSVEENIVSPSLGLKGSIDAVLEAESKTLGHKHNSPSSTNAVRNSGPQQSLMCLELKTGHNQNIQNVHMAQLSLYTFMLQSRYGALLESNENANLGSHPTQRAAIRGGAPGGILLYLNDKSQQICHVSPQMNEVKTLMSQRNVVASDSIQALRPRGISLSFNEEDRKENEDYLTAKLLPAPTANLPEVKSSAHSCERCFSKRECMLYAASDPTSDMGTHHNLLSRFTGHLGEEEMEYFRKWDRLIDIEAESSDTKASTPWLTNSRGRETEMEESISGMTFSSQSSHKVANSDALVCFRRKTETCSQSSCENLNIVVGSHVIVSTDGNPMDNFTRKAPNQKQHQNRMYITKGSVDRIEEDRIFISTTLDEMNRIKLLTTQYHQQQSENGVCSEESLLFRLDKSTATFGTGTLRWNLINFLTSDYTGKKKEETTELDLIKQRRLTWLRDVVIRLKAPEFAEDPHASLFYGHDLQIPGCNLQELSKEFCLLNHAQQMAVRKVMSGRDYTLIQGLPGTGKTSTLAFLTRLLVARGRRVLITAYTHSAVDNIMSKLMDKGMGSRDRQPGLSDLVRLGSKRLNHGSLKPITHTELALEFDKMSGLQSTHDDVAHPSATSLKQVIATSRVLGVSALTLPRSPLLQSEIFDVVIIDEAGQMNEPTAIGALAAADSFILVGDHKQLPPLVNSVIADKGGYGISILKKLADQHPHAIAPLTMQYRMNEEICKISSESIYGGQMQCGNDRVRSQLLELPEFPSSLPTPSSDRCVAWLHSILDPKRSVVFVDTDKIKEKEKTMALEGKLGGSIVNGTEAELVWHVLKAMELCGHDLSEIGVISPFRAQIKVIEDNTSVAPWKKKGLEMSTIDKYQGRDKSTIILSLVRSNTKGTAGRLLQDARRLNVAFTRAKCKLIVIGSYGTLKNGSAPLKPILNRMEMRKQRIELPDNALECYNIM